jgi:hypothetical protein
LGHSTTAGGLTGGEDEQLLETTHPSESAITVSSDLSVCILEFLDDGGVVRLGRETGLDLLLERLGGVFLSLGFFLCPSGLIGAPGGL